jgi:hypothetical protein
MTERLLIEADLAHELERDDPEHGGARLCVVRYFDDGEGEEERLSHPRTLVAVNADVDVDEYG